MVRPVRIVIELEKILTNIVRIRTLKSIDWLKLTKKPILESKTP